MTAEQKSGPIAIANELANYLDGMARVAKEHRVGETSGDASYVHEVIRSTKNKEAAEELSDLLHDAVAVAQDAPTVDDGGSGDGTLETNFLNQLALRGYPRTGAKLVVQICVDEEGNTLDVRLL
ncbi:MAG: hypothetical protein EON54_09245 [Alcaligenaceae bacterium]|nr:MAG: hypothetical protein EON54_09245 [Alcaligenaceae bacterium]